MVGFDTLALPHMKRRLSHTAAILRLGAIEEERGALGEAEAIYMQAIQTIDAGNVDAWWGSC